MIRVLIVVLLCPACDVLLGLNSVPDAQPIDTPPEPDAPDAGVVDPCSLMSMLADDFEDNDLSVLWTVRTATTESGGHAVLDLTSPTFAQLATQRYYDLLGGNFTVEITDT